MDNWDRETAPGQVGATGLGWTTGPRHWQLPSVNVDFPARFAP